MTQLDFVIIGGGQAGLAMAYYIKQTNLSFIVLDSNERSGDNWRKRYDSLFLFTPRMYNHLPVLHFPGDPNGLPSKDEAADYLELYAKHFELPVRFKTVVLLLQKTKNGFLIRTNQVDYIAKNVVVCTGPFQKPAIPAFIHEISDDIYQVHSSSYHKPSELQRGSVLIVGAGNSGAQIAVELAKEREVSLSIGHKMSFKPLYILGKSIFWYFEKLGLLRADVQTRRGLWLKNQPEQIYGLELKRLLKNNRVQTKPRVVNAKGKTIIFEDGSIARPDNIVWATGFRTDYNWIDIAGAMKSDGLPDQKRGISPIPGLYFLGLPWQSCRGSALLGWVGQDAEYLWKQMTKRK
ncbi:MAG: FAD-dependent pyridine nucleotide-disulfide oxidoreductase [Paenibacillus sp.]|jgi:putative flavoprotein involved in K+ transport|nr:FAD-dependent pyridine nucleotide-disulfide oxidoreductase [Paenibacillus sp.]